jgi:hypothetical protein
MKAIQQINQFIWEKTPLEYRGKSVILDGVSERDGEVRIQATVDGKQQTFVKEIGEKLDLFLVNFKVKEPVADKHLESNPAQETQYPAVVKSRKSSEVQQVPAILQKHQHVFERLSVLLLEDIEKVRIDPAYVSQAKQVANTANAMINLAKLELEMVTKG